MLSDSINVQQNYSSKPIRRASVREVAEKLCEDIKATSGNCYKNLSEDSKPYSKMLLDGEKVVLDGLVVKKSGWSFKSRILVLTSRPRLMYFTPQGDFKGLIPWSMTEPLEVIKVCTTTLTAKFVINVAIYIHTSM